MKKHLITFGTLILFVASGPALLAQDDATARLMARRAAEAAGNGDAAAAAPAQDAPATTTTVTTGDAGATNTATTMDDDEARRKAAIQAALKEADAAAVMPTNLAATLQIITRRNIFDPQRRPYQEPRDIPVVPIARVDTFILTGTSEIIGKGLVAFFSGSGIPDYPFDHCIGDNINGLKIKDITLDGVKLVDPKASSSNAEYVLQLQTGLTRSDGGPWKTAYSTITYASAAPRMQRMDDAPVDAYRAPLMATVVTPETTFGFAPGDTSADDPTGLGTGRRRGQRGQGGQGGQGRQRGGGGNPNGGFAPGGAAAPSAPVDPIVEARLRAARLKEQ